MVMSSDKLWKINSIKSPCYHEHDKVEPMSYLVVLMTKSNGDNFVFMYYPQGVLG